MSGTLRVWFFAGDLLILNLSIMASLVFFGDAMSAGSGVNSIYLLVFSNLVWLFLVMMSTPYSVTKGWSLSKIVRSQAAFLFIHLLVVASLIFFFKQQYTIFQVALIYILFIPLFLLFRVIALYLRKVFTEELSVKNYVIVGKNDLAYEVRRFYLIHRDYGLRFKGYLDIDNESSVERISEYCVQNNIQEICCCVPLESGDVLNKIVQFGLNSLIKVRVVNDLPGIAKPIRFDKHDQLPGLDMATIPLDETRNQVVKRIFDLVFSTAFIVLVMSWLLPIIAIAIKIDSRGPVFFVQLRSGRGNKPFRCLKFRSMVVNTASDSLQATRNDRRITKLGHFIRKTSIDELPQFFNVFMGSMSVVGPRPHMLKHTEEYSQLIDKFMGRHYVKAGITGLAQCLGYRGETQNVSDMENRVRLDRYYIEHWTFWFDVKICFLTVISLIRGSDKAF